MRVPGLLLRGVLGLAALAGAAFIGFNVLIALGFWLKPSVQPREEDEGVSFPSVAIAEGDLPGKWPLTVPSGTLDCYTDGPISFSHGSGYALNRAALDAGFPDVATLARPGASLEPLRRRAAELCAEALKP